MKQNDEVSNVVETGFGFHVITEPTSSDSFILKPLHLKCKRGFFIMEAHKDRRRLCFAKFNQIGGV